MKAIVAVDNKWGIGKNNDLLFSIPEDMKFFRATTLNKVVVMGSNTLKSFPNGIENSVFHIGKVIVVSIAATLGTASVAAHSVANSIVGMACIPGAAMSLGIITVVGQCVGAKEYEQAEYYTRNLIKWTQITFIGLNILLTFVTTYTVSLYNLSSEASETAVRIVYLHNLLSGFFF